MCHPPDGLCLEAEFWLVEARTRLPQETPWLRALASHAAVEGGGLVVRATREVHRESGHRWHPAALPATCRRLERAGWLEHDADDRWRLTFP